MAQPRITVIINGTTYSLCADNAEAIGNMPTEDRLHLLALLDVVRREGDPPPAAAPAARAAPANPSPTLRDARAATTRFASAPAVPERMGSGDIDALMARLAAEEQRSRRPALTRAGIYKLTGGFLLLIFLLVVIL